MYLLSRTKLAGSLIHRSRYTLSRTRGPTKQVASEISVNVYPFNLKFPTYIIYIHINWFLQLQTNQACVPLPVKVESGSDHVAIDSWWSHRSWIHFPLGAEQLPGWSVNVGNDCSICKYCVWESSDWMNTHSHWSHQPPVSSDPEFSRAYIENGGLNYPRVLCGLVGMLYAMCPYPHIWYNMMSMIPGVRNSPTFVHIPPPCALSRKSHYSCVWSGRLHSWHLKYNVHPSSTQRKDRNNRNKVGFAS